MSGLIANSKYGSCNRCKATDTPCRKRGKILLCMSCCRKEDVEKQLEKQKDRRKVQASLSKLSKTPENREAVKKEQSKSELLKQADRLFGDFVKRRDTVDGKIKCPCCRKWYDIDAKMHDGSKLVQPLHFVSRKVYSQRWNELQVFAGCGLCNKRQHDNPRGIEYQNYREFLVDLYGEQEVVEIELSHRAINRIEEQQLRTIIELYS